MCNKTTNNNENQKKAVEAIKSYLTNVISFTDLQDEIHDATLKVLENYQNVDECDGDTRPYMLAFEAKKMLDLIRPFAVELGQVH